MTMMAESLSIQPWARKAPEEGSLQDILARVNFERGHFREITEASLQEEIAAEGALETSESDEDEDIEADDVVDAPAGPPATREELYKAKHEMLANVRAAEQEMLMSLDFISLLLSKDAPKQAAPTVSPFLKEAVPLGSLGTDLWQRMPVDTARDAQDELLATNVRLQSLQRGADDLLSAAARLQDNVRKETEYWNQVLSISEKGWNVSRVPGQQHRLAVRFGFSESSPEYSRRGMAALNASPDGSIALDRGLDRKPKALYVTLRREKKVVGCSRLPRPANSEEQTLEARIRYARDSLYDEELYHEMIRESRTLSSLGVSMEGSAIKFGSHADQHDDLEASLELVAVDEVQYSHFDTAETDNRMAEATLLAARLLLSQAHRELLKRRSLLPPPLSDKRKDERPLLPILRPMLAFFMHQRAITQVNEYLESVASTLRAAKVEVESRPARLQLPQQADIRDSEALVSTLLQPWRSKAHLNFTVSGGKSLSFSFDVHTDLADPSNFTSVLMLEVPGEEQSYRFERIDELIPATDAKVSSALAESLLQTVGDDWIHENLEATLVKRDEIDGGTVGMSIWLDGQEKQLTMQSSSIQVCWRAETDEEQKGLLEEVTELAAAMKYRD